MTRTGLRTVLERGRYFEGRRWHDGRLWFVDCLARTLLSTDASGICQEHASLTDDTPCHLGSLPDGSVRVVAEGLRFPNGMAEMDGECLAQYEMDAEGGLRSAAALGG